jgi:hypothetical protein
MGAYMRHSAEFKRLFLVASMTLLGTIKLLTSCSAITTEEMPKRMLGDRKQSSTSSGNFSYAADVVKLLAGQSSIITPTIAPSIIITSFSITPSLPAGLAINSDGSIAGTPTLSTGLQTFTVNGLDRNNVKHSADVKIQIFKPLSLASSTTPLTETSVSVSWTATESSVGLDSYQVELIFADLKKKRIIVDQTQTSTIIQGLKPGSTFSCRVKAMYAEVGKQTDANDLVSTGFTPFGAINVDSSSAVPQEPWKPSGLEGLAISENFSIVWSFYYNPGFTPAWKGVPSKTQKGDFYFNTSLNRAYQNTNGLLWGDTGSRDDVTQIWTNGIDKFMVGTWRGRLHLWDQLPNAPDKVAHTREIGLGSTNRSKFSGTSSACYDASVNKLYVTNGNWNRVLIFNGWPTTSNPDADYVLGQPDFDTFSAATTSTGMKNPWSVSCEGGILAVGDVDNARVLIWTKPITTNNQAADFIYGQSNATSGSANGAGGVNAGGLAHPRSVLLVPRSSGGYALVVADTTQNRIVEWDRISATPATQTFPGSFDRLYGQPNRSSVTPNTDGQSMSSLAAPVALSLERDKNGQPKNDTFWVADGAYWTTHNSRILKYQRGNSTAIDLWGDADGTTSLSGWTYPKDRIGFWWANYVNFSRIGCLGSQGIYNLGSYVWKNAPANGITPSDFTDANRCHTATAGGKTWIANGASIWGLEVSDGQSAPSPLSGSPVLLGRKNADGTDNTGIADSHEFKISGVGDMANFGSLLLVLDGHRIAIWNTSVVSNHAMVTTVIGQPSKTTNAENQGGLSAKTLNGPSSMVIHQGKVIVADRGNNRILIWNNIPATDDQPANVILGQTSGITRSTGTSLAEMNTPTSAAVINGKLVVNDRGNHRILVWDSIPTVTGQVAARSLDLRNYRFSLPEWYNPNALSPVWIRAFQDRVYVEQYGRVLVIPDIF